MDSWNFLRDLNSCFDLPSLSARDFNEITKSHEKLGYRLRPFKQMQYVWEIIYELGFTDLGFVGNKHMWCRQIM